MASYCPAWASRSRRSRLGSAGGARGPRRTRQRAAPIPHRRGPATSRRTRGAKASEEDLQELRRLVEEEPGRMRARSAPARVLHEPEGVPVQEPLDGARERARSPARGRPGPPANARASPRPGDQARSRPRNRRRTRVKDARAGGSGQVGTARGGVRAAGAKPLRRRARRRRPAPDRETARRVRSVPRSPRVPQRPRGRFPDTAPSPDLARPARRAT
jgi:hypothetical protein